MSDLLTVQEASRILKVDDTTVRHWAKEGAFDVLILPSVGNGKNRRYRIKRESFEVFVEQYRGKRSERSTTTN